MQWFHFINIDFTFHFASFTHIFVIVFELASPRVGWQPTEFTNINGGENCQKLLDCAKINFQLKIVNLLANCGKQ